MFEQAGGFFENLRKVDKTYRKYFQEKLAPYGFSPNEITVILFLTNNAPPLDTATDIARCKGISKGLIARSVESLCRRGYLETARDERDRRVIHLRFREDCRELLKDIERIKKELEEELQRDISPEALRVTRETMNRLLLNTETLISRKGPHTGPTTNIEEAHHENEESNF